MTIGIYQICFDNEKAKLFPYTLSKGYDAQFSDENDNLGLDEHL